jgi:antitoxin component YwqK of YwqJK toxin-antitoxin module
MKLLLPLIAVLVFTASAADVTGTWKAATETPNGNFETTFKFKADGAKLTGSTSNQFMSDTAISDGKVDGDNISFTVNANFNGNEIKLNYKGKVSADELKLTLEIPGRDRTIEMTAKRAS